MSFGKTYREEEAVSVSWLTAADEFADDDHGASGLVDEDESSSDSRFGGIPMPQWCRHLLYAHNHNGPLQVQHVPFIHRICEAIR